jgi:hypothetical protein
MNKLSIGLILLSIFVSSCNEKEKNKTSEFLKGYDKIRLISYNTHRDVYSSQYELKVQNDTVRIPNINVIDNVVLDKRYSEKIATILFSTESECLLADCYNPRHLILFYKKNKIVDFYEICAECGGSRQSKNIDFPEFCTDKGDQIIALFKEMKLKNDGEEGENYKYF